MYIFYIVTLYGVTMFIYVYMNLYIQKDIIIFVILYMGLKLHIFFCLSYFYKFHVSDFCHNHFLFLLENAHHVWSRSALKF